MIISWKIECIDRLIDRLTNKRRELCITDRGKEGTLRVIIAIFRALPPDPAREQIYQLSEANVEGKLANQRDDS